MDIQTLRSNIIDIAAAFARDRNSRQRRRELHQEDFEQLRDAGFLLTGVPTGQGGLWIDPHHSAREVCGLIRILAHGDPSVALVAAMHPTVLAFWLHTPVTDAGSAAAWRTQRAWVANSVLDGAWWGTITSEPGSGGDIAMTRSRATRTPGSDGYLLSGDKHFGSGSGITSYMITTAIAEGETEPDLFILDVKSRLWDGSSGMQLVAEWDGHGMAATQSHAFRFIDYPAIRSALPGEFGTIMPGLSGYIGCVFTSVIIGIVETALDLAGQQMQKRYPTLSAYERFEWTRAETEGWLIQQAYTGMLSALEASPDARHQVLLGKTAIAELAETLMGRLCRVLGGGTYSRHSPFGYWFEDVRALGFLRPPWPLAYQNLLESSLAPE